MKKWVLGFFFLLHASLAFGQLSYSGNVLDASDKKYLEGVFVEVIGSSENDSTNSRGYFNLKARPGDSLRITFPGFLDQKILLSSDRYLQIQIQDRARFLPTFEVKSEPYAFRFKDGKLTVIDPNEIREKSPKGQVTAGPSGSPNGGFAVYGAISYFTKKARLAREYEKKQEWDRRRAGYYAIIESDSVRKNLMIKYQLVRPQWDKLVIQYNEGNAHHEFLDWPKDRVYAHFNSFIVREKDWIY
jgi:hypothetical protein